jgi:TRAP-type C4-dicarboxylate transport system permease small subunit
MAYLAGFLICLMVFSVCYEIVLRYFFGRPTLWSAGLVEYIMLCVTFLGTAWLLKRDGHVRIDIVLIAMTDRGRAMLNVFTSFLSLVSCVVMCWYGVKSTWNIFVRKVMTAQDPEIPKFILLIVIPLGFFFLSIEFIKKILEGLALLKTLKTREEQRGRGTS